jgi:acyl-coenzyme A thioesterase PaaI-like protein
VRSDPDAVWRTTTTGASVPSRYDVMVDELRVLLDRVAAAAPPEDLVDDITKLVGEINTRLLPHDVDEVDRLSGQLLEQPGRGQLLVPAYHVDELDEDRMAGRVRFGRQFLGSNGAVHGGAIPLLFDDVLGRLALVGERRKSRTAYLHVDYRSIAPIEEDLQVEAWFDREEGRKRRLRGVLRQGDRVCAEADGLFVELRPGQP